MPEHPPNSKATYSTRLAREWDKVAPVDMPNLTGYGHQVKYIQEREIMKTRELKRKTGLSAASTSLTIFESLQSGPGPSDEPKRTPRYDEIFSSDSNKAHSPPRPQSARLPGGNQKSWAREKAARVPRLVSNDSIEHEVSSDDFEDYYAVPKDAPSTSKLSQFATRERRDEEFMGTSKLQRRTREVWDETSHMATYGSTAAAAVSALPMATIKVNVPAGNANELHKYLKERLTRWWRGHNRQQVALQPQAMSSPNVETVAKRRNRTRQSNLEQMTPTRRSKRISALLSPIPQQQQQINSANSQTTHQSFFQSRLLLERVREYVRDLSDIVYWSLFALIWLVLLLLGLYLFRCIGVGSRFVFPSLHSETQHSSWSERATAKEQQPQQQQQFVHGSVESGVGGGGGVGGLNSAEMTKAGVDVNSGQEGDLFSRIEKLQSELYKLELQSGKTSQAAGKRPEILQVPYSSDSLQQDILSTQSKIDQFARSLEVLEREHASLALSDAKLQNTAEQLTLQLRRNIESSQLNFKQMEADLKVLTDASSQQLKRELLHQIGANISKFEQQLLTITALAELDTQKFAQASERQSQGLEKLEERLALLEANNAGLKNCCSIAEELSANISHNMSQLKAYEDKVSKMKLTIDQLSEEIKKSNLNVELLKEQILLTGQKTAGQEQEKQSVELGNYMTTDQFNLAMAAYEKNLARMVSSQHNETCDAKRSQRTSEEFADISNAFKVFSGESNTEQNYSLLAQFLDAYFYNLSSSEQFRTLVRQEVQRALSEDGTGLADYALESVGGTVVSTRCTETYTEYASVVTLLGIPLWYQTPSPRIVIQPEMSPGNCWPFKGASGQVVIRLARRIKVQSVSYQHIPPSISPAGSFSSAPKDISIFGLNSESDDPGTLLGNFSYDMGGNGMTLQTYPMENLAQNEREIDPSFRYIAFVVHSNHGNNEYTCLYRIRVHGQVASS
ncbi:uncharacterized protein LOC142341425 isoform X3 [Convolutriloba macropyga]|uniref:uncharacterized protein LOC142341425 isoform X3 n=1 Tax=Convolutriloba macropyga TaxID=536237 RepID=UPI003F522EE4